MTGEPISAFPDVGRHGWTEDRRTALEGRPSPSSTPRGRADAPAAGNAARPRPWLGAYRGRSTRYAHGQCRRGERDDSPVEGLDVPVQWARTCGCRKSRLAISD